MILLCNLSSSYMNLWVHFLTVRVPKPVEESNHFDSDTELEDEIEEVDEDKTESEEEEEEEPAVRNIARSSRHRGKDIVSRSRCKIYRYT